MKTLAQILKIALTHLDGAGYTCHAVSWARNNGEITEAEEEYALFQIGEMVGHSEGATIPIWLIERGAIDIDNYENFIALRHMVIGAWIDKLESLEENNNEIFS